MTTKLVSIVTGTCHCIAIACFAVAILTALVDVGIVSVGMAVSMLPNKPKETKPTGYPQPSIYDEEPSPSPFTFLANAARFMFIMISLPFVSLFFGVCFQNVAVNLTSFARIPANPGKPGTIPMKKVVAALLALLVYSSCANAQSIPTLKPNDPPAFTQPNPYASMFLRQSDFAIQRSTWYEEFCRKRSAGYYDTTRTDRTDSTPGKLTPANSKPAKTPKQLEQEAIELLELRLKRLRLEHQLRLARAQEEWDTTR